MTKPPDFTRYRAKSLKTYTSTEWLADSQKKYRTVFDQGEVSYIYAELAFYNKLFDEEDWTAKLCLRAFKRMPDGRPGPQICNIEAEKMVTQDQNIVYYREGWGNDRPGHFWKEGEYFWEAYIDGVKVDSCEFYVYTGGTVSDESNPYFSVSAVRLFEGANAESNNPSGKYYQAFKHDLTRYVWVEFQAQNLLKSNWMMELVFNFYNDARQLKGRTTELLRVSKDQHHIQVSSGWGSDHKGTWFPDNYTVEIVFMENLIGVLPFSVGSEFVEGHRELMRPTEGGEPVISTAPQAEPEKNLEELLAELDSLIGLAPVKARIHEYVQYLKFIQLRQEKGFEDAKPGQLHVVFTGNPGTGKTTIARMLGKIYHKLGLLSKGHVHEVDRADIIGEYIGQTAPKVRAAIDKARGGLLFIDEAYALARSGEDSKDFGREAIELILKEMSDGPGDLAVIVAGYPREMEIFLASNPGLKSRFTMRFDFPDYTPPELEQILRLGADKTAVTFAEDALAFISKKILEAWRNRGRTFGNARYALSLVNEAKLNLGLRIMRQPNPEVLPEDALTQIQLQDVKGMFDGGQSHFKALPIDEDLLRESLDELDQLVGLNNIKTEIQDMVKLVRFYRETGKDVLHRFSMHTVFSGNPGTGKTTVARIVGRIYKALGILERGNVVEVDRQGLVAQYVGQTAEKTAAVIEQARGGVLFIDEAYGLAAGGAQDFGREAIDTLLKRMEDLRGELVVIAAGYTDPMQAFLESNPGLKSRFDRRFEFMDYTPEEMLAIAIAMFRVEGIVPSEEAQRRLMQYFLHLHQHKNKFFGNARAVRKVVEKAVKNQHLRLAAMPSALRTPEALAELELADVKEFAPGNDSLMEGSRQGRVGF
ncbi:MAG: AAA family ATPase [Bacteroidia bacterium]|nr:AAA family ATPase [Bacteroidia bacterium]